MTSSYSERLSVPLRWWVQATMFLATVWLAFIVALPAWIAWTATGAMTATTYGLFLWVGSARIEVAGGVLRAGTAHIPVALLGDVIPLDAETTKRVHGVDANALAFLLTRPYVKRGVKVVIEDPADRTPYWLLSTRHPTRLAQALGWSEH